MSRKIQGSVSHWVVGVDLGQRLDYSAVAALEVLENEFDQRDPVTYAFIRERRFRLRLIERVALGTPYTEIVTRLRDIVNSRELKTRSTLVMDATGVGAPVVELTRAAKPGCRIVPVTITGGDQERTDGSRYSVPKRDLMLGLQVAIERRKLEIAEGSKAARELVEELKGMRSTATGFGRQRYGAAGSGHDDLVMAVALAWWWVRKQLPQSCLGAVAA